MKTRFLLALGLLTAPTLAQPTTQALPPSKPLVPKMTPEEWSKLVGAPTRVTLNFEDAKPDIVIAELSRQARVPVEFHGDLDENAGVTVHAANSPFWEAMRQVCSAFNVEPQQWGGNRALSLESGELPIPGLLVPLHPLVTLKIIKASVKRNVFYGLQPGDGRNQEEPEISIEGAVLLDPKVDALRYGMRLNVQQIVDEKENGVLPPPLDFGGEAWIRSFELALQWRPDMGQKLVRLKGTIRLVSVLKREKWEIADVMNAKGASKTVKSPFGIETWVLESTEPVPSEIGRQYRVLLRRIPQAVPAKQPDLQDDIGLSLDWQQMVRMLDAQGRSYRVSNAMAGQDVSEMVFLEPQDGGKKAGPPAKLLIEFPTDLRQIELPFEIKDLVLP